MGEHFLGEIPVPFSIVLFGLADLFLAIPCSLSF